MGVSFLACIFFSWQMWLTKITFLVQIQKHQ